MIEWNDTHNIFDSSKIVTHMTCPRRFFYRYILGWEIESDNYHLIFGQAWHKGMEVIMAKGNTPEAVEEAFDAFLSHYRKYFPNPELDDTRGVKTPEKALLGFTTYIDVYGEEAFEIVDTEIAGTVPIDIDVNASFRIDAVCKFRHGYFIMEHKTASRDTSSWRNSFVLSPQISMYIHALKCIFPGNEVWGARVNGVIFRTKDIGLQRIPVRKTIPQMQCWLENTQNSVRHIKSDMSDLRHEESKKDSPIMQSFKMNTSSCTAHFGLCPYHDLCVSWDNPLHHLEKEPPIGFRVRWWNPLIENEKNAKKIVNL